MNRALKRSLIKLSITVGIIILFLLGLKIFVEYFATRRMTPLQKKRFEQWRTKKYYFAPEDLNAPPFTTGTLAARNAFQKMFKEHEKSLNDTYNKFEAIRKQEGKTTATATWEDFCREVPSAESILVAFGNLVSQPDYDIDCLSEDLNIDVEYGVFFPVPNFLHCQMIIRLLRMKTKALIKKGKISEALDTVAYIFRSSRTHRYSILPVRLISINFWNTGLQTLYEATRQCDNPIFLHRALELLKESEPRRDLIEADEDISVTDHIGEIRQARRIGIAVDIQGKTGQEIAWVAFSDVPAAYLEKCVLPTVQDKSRRTEIKKTIARYRDGAASFRGNILTLPLISSIMFSVAVPDFEEVYTRWRVVHARLDILRCFMEQKITALEHKGKIPQIPGDIFSSAGEPLRTMPVIYSIGPDGMNQQAGIYYDPTNGTISSGDIFFK